MSRKALRLGAVAALLALVGIVLPLRVTLEQSEVVQTRMRRFDHARPSDFADGEVEGGLVRGAEGEPALSLPSEGVGAYTSGPIDLGMTATSLGAHWTVARDGSVAVLLRASDDGERWSDWHQLEGEAAAVHAVALFALDSASQSRTILRPLVSPATAQATIKPLGIVARAQWGADESLRFEKSSGRLGGEIWPEEVARVERIVVHHTAGPNVCASPEAYCQRRSVVAINDIYHFHNVANGWGDI